MIEVFDNFLSKTYHKELFDVMNSPEFDWYFNSVISIKDTTDRGSLYEYGFSHNFWDKEGIRNSQMAMFWKPGLLSIMDAVLEHQKATESAILRSRADMTMVAPVPFIHEPHRDFDFDNISTILYLNDTDGDTILYDDITEQIQERVAPKANRLIVFNGNQLHTGCSPTKTKNRIVINSNFETEKL